MILSVYSLLSLVRYESGVWRGEADVSHYDQFGGVAYRHLTWSDFSHVPGSLQDDWVSHQIN